MLAPSLVLILCVASLRANDVHLGYAGPNSRRIFSEIRQADPALWTRTDDVVVNAVGTEIISAVSVTDLRDDKDGEAYIESGGIGAKSVTIGLKSPSILRGYKFQVEVYVENQNARYLGYNAKSVYPSSTVYSGAYNNNYGVKGGSAPYYDNGQYARKY